MAENIGSDESEFESITSSQKSFLKNCPFAVPGALPTDSDNTEVLGNQISPAVVQTPVISLSSPTSLDSINDEIFRTPPENASLSSAAESEPTVRVSQLKPREPSNLKSPSSKTKPTPFSENVAPLSSPPSVVSGDVRVPAKHPALDSPSPTEIEKTISLENQPISDSGLSKTSESEDSGVLVPLSSPPSVRIPAKHSLSPTAIETTMDLENQPISDSVVSSEVSKSPDSVMKTSETEDSGGALPFKEIIEALLRNSGENASERDEKVSYVDILKQCGLKFP